MRLSAQRARQLVHYGNVAVALAVSACLLGLLGFGFAAVPALGPALVPGHGAWTSAAGGKLPISQTLRLTGLTRPVAVSFTSAGLASIDAQTDADAFQALGYVHAKFRLAEMDVERRLAEGGLAQLAGRSAVGSDKFELRLGLIGTAQQEWAQMAKASPAAQALIAYSRGVNDYLAQVRAGGQWPAVFSLAGVYPQNWTPVDSLAIQAGLTQGLDFNTMPLDYALLERSLGPQRTMAWFPVQPPNQQSPYDPGPYRNLGLAPMVPSTTVAPTAAAVSAPSPGAKPARTATAVSAPAPSADLARASAAILAQADALPPGQLYTAPASNAWAANGPKVAGGGAMLAGDPHVLQTLPSIWYQVALSAPGLAVSGVSVPGLPAIMIGHNAHIAWSLTDTQSQAALFYDEQTSPSRPRQYFWRGQWRKDTVLHYTIDVRGAPPVPLYVDETVHGPVLTEDGQTVSVDWVGARGSPDEAAMLAIDQATDFSQFKAALANWRSPALTFVYADDRGNIGAISPGYYPQVSNGQPWLPMPGTGADDVAGVIPYAAVPQVYDPASHVIATANQRPVAASYPYYLGTTATFFDPGYRANAEYAYLGNHWSMQPSNFAALQGSLGDQLAGLMVPRLLAALKNRAPGEKPLTPLQQLAEGTLASWNYQMSAESAGASIWWTFWAEYLATVFKPWWDALKVPIDLDKTGLSVGPGQFSLNEDLQAWTIGDQANAAFTSPGGVPRTAQKAMRYAFALTVRSLNDLLGGGPGRWQWAKLHTRQFPSLTGAVALGYGPRGAGGDPWTVDAAEGGLNSTIGPTWRMIVHWSGVGHPVAVGIYPGGQSENPASPWYSNMIADWWAGTYLPLPAAGSAGPVSGSRGSSRVGASVADSGGASSGVTETSGARSAKSGSGTARTRRGINDSGGIVYWKLLP